MNKIIISLFLILVLTFVTFLPSLKSGFVWDDDLYITENNYVRALSTHNLKKIFTSFFGGNYQPLLILSFLLEFQAVGLSPFLYHLNNLLIHLLNCLLVFWFIYLLSRKFFVCLVTTFFFAIHPLRVESVAWISERKDLLFAFFFLGALISYSYYLLKNRGRFYFFYYLCLFLFLFSLLSKAMAVTLPFVLLLLDYYFGRKLRKAIFLEKIPFFALSFVFSALIIIGQYSIGAIRPESYFNIPGKFINAAYALVFYLQKVIFPFGLSCLYPLPPLRMRVLFSLLFVLLILLAVLFYRRTHSRKFVFGCIFFLVTIFPVIQFVPVGNSLAAERYSYIPSIGLFYIFSEGACRFYNQRRLLTGGLIIAVLLTFSFLSFRRLAAWKDGISLWSDCMRKYPWLTIPYNNRGDTFLKRGEYEKAAADFKKAIELNKDPKASLNYYLNLARAYRFNNETKLSLDTLQKVIEIDPGFAEAYFHLAELYESLGETEKAEAMYREAFEKEPKHFRALNNLGALYFNRGKVGEAALFYKQAISTEPSFAEAYFNLGLADYSLGLYPQATALFEKTIAINPLYLSAYLNLFHIYSQQGNEQKAISLYKKAKANGLRLLPP